MNTSEYSTSNIITDTIHSGRCSPLRYARSGCKSTLAPSTPDRYTGVITEIAVLARDQNETNINRHMA